MARRSFPAPEAGHNELSEDTQVAREQKDTEGRRKSSKKANAEAQSDNAAISKRKRKSNDLNAVPASNRKEEEPRSLKRKKTGDDNKENEAEGDEHSSAEAQLNGDLATASESPSKKPRKSKKGAAQKDTDETKRRLARPSEVTQARPRRSNLRGTVGFFTSEEVQALERFKISFCNEHEYDASTFDEMVQHSERDKDIDFPCPISVMTKTDFWRSVYEILPNRDKRSVYRFMRRHFQTSDVKPHKWTHEQDEELIQLISQHGQKFAHIARMIGRNDDDVVQRWKNRLEHRGTMKRGPWTEEEVVKLQNALQKTLKSLQEMGKERKRDIYEMDESLIAWGQISDLMGNVRSRQQCADKWRKTRRKVMHLRANGNPNAIYDYTAEKNKAKSRTTTPAPTQRQEAQIKSNERVESEDDEDEEDPSSSADKDQLNQNDSASDSDKKPAQKQPKTKSTETPKVNGHKSAKKIKPSGSIQKRKRSPSTSSSSSDSEDESESESEPAHKRASLGNTATKRSLKGGEPTNSESEDDSASGSSSEASETDTDSEDETKPAFTPINQKTRNIPAAKGPTRSVSSSPSQEIKPEE
ncbi:hypothetical protein BDV25DRAFT_160152 [Aspergillus avenaceus]|uniref:Uncharacterized protein n=1 Tax=Aspergillus avenaceus TaxID=36643 RepID=A0A5N6TN53_ASPAV|nr:hypothetical protein BDV25DRAFT_160152 [Aspergillus avenaceus]